MLIQELNTLLFEAQKVEKQFDELIISESSNLNNALAALECTWAAICLQKAISQYFVTNSLQVLKAALAERWESIQNTPNAYPHDNDYESLKALYIRLAKLLATEIGNVHWLQLLMPGLILENGFGKEWDDETLLIEECILSDDNRALIQIPPVIECAVEDRKLKTIRNQQAVPLSENEVKRVFAQSPQAEKIFLLISEHQFNLEQSKHANAINKLIEALRTAGKSVKGHEDEAHASIFAAIDEFKQYLTTCTETERTQLMNSKNARGDVTFSTLWEQLSPTSATLQDERSDSEGQGSQYCVEVLASSMSSIARESHRLHTGFDAAASRANIASHIEEMQRVHSYNSKPSVYPAGFISMFKRWCNNPNYANVLSKVIRHNSNLSRKLFEAKAFTQEYLLSTAEDENILFALEENNLLQEIVEALGTALPAWTLALSGLVAQKIAEDDVLNAKIIQQCNEDQLVKYAEHLLTENISLNHQLLANKRICAIALEKYRPLQLCQFTEAQVANVIQHELLDLFFIKIQKNRTAFLIRCSKQMVTQILAVICDDELLAVLDILRNEQLQGMPLSAVKKIMKIGHIIEFLNKLEHTLGDWLLSLDRTVLLMLLADQRVIELVTEKLPVETLLQLTKTWLSIKTNQITFLKKVLSRAQPNHLMTFSQTLIDALIQHDLLAEFLTGLKEEKLKWLELSKSVCVLEQTALLDPSLQSHIFTSCHNISKLVFTDQNKHLLTQENIRIMFKRLGWLEFTKWLVASNAWAFDSVLKNLSKELQKSERKSVIDEICVNHLDMDDNPDRGLGAYFDYTSSRGLEKLSRLGNLLECVNPGFAPNSFAETTDYYQLKNQLANTFWLARWIRYRRAVGLGVISYSAISNLRPLFYENISLMALLEILDLRDLRSIVKTFLVYRCESELLQKKNLQKLISVHGNAEVLHWYIENNFEPVDDLLEAFSKFYTRKRMAQILYVLFHFILRGARQHECQPTNSIVLRLMDKRRVDLRLLNRLMNSDTIGTLIDDGYLFVCVTKFKRKFSEFIANNEIGKTYQVICDSKCDKALRVLAQQKTSDLLEMFRQQLQQGKPIHPELYEQLKQVLHQGDHLQKFLMGQQIKNLTLLMTVLQDDWFEFFMQETQYIGDAYRIRPAAFLHQDPAKTTALVKHLSNDVFAHEFLLQNTNIAYVIQNLEVFIRDLSKAKLQALTKVDRIWNAIVASNLFDFYFQRLRTVRSDWLDQQSEARQSQIASNPRMHRTLEKYLQCRDYLEFKSQFHPKTDGLYQFLQRMYACRFFAAPVTDEISATTQENNPSCANN